MGLHSIIVGVRGLILIPISIIALGSIAIVLLFLRVDEDFMLEGWDDMPPMRRDFDTAKYSTRVQEQMEAGAGLASARGS